MSDSDDSDIPDVGMHVNIQPYMFEPTKKSNSKDRPIDSSESESDHDQPQARHHDTRTDNDAWCDCSHCVVMPTSLECLCCQEISLISNKTEERDLNCITLHDGFIANCLNRDVLEVSIYEFVEQDGPIGDNEPAHEMYRYIAYRRFARWIWHRLGKRNRRVLPACVVNTIRQTFPAEQYCGFKYVMP